MRLRDTRMHCAFSDSANPVILRESCWREATFQALATVTSLSLHTHTHTTIIMSTCMARCVSLNMLACMCS
jgi:hypothetical protein